MKLNYMAIDTPALLIDEDILMDNIRHMQNVANHFNVALRPHGKSHKTPEIARRQLVAGAVGIAVAKVGEAEVMATEGIHDIFIANQIVGKTKIERIANLCKENKISMGVDCKYHIDEINEIFKNHGLIADVLIEIEIGENRSGIIYEKDFVELVKYIETKNHVNLKGIFSHDGHSYHAQSVEELKAIFLKGQKDTLFFVDVAKAMGHEMDIVSVGSTPPFMFEFEVLKGITEIRIGSYVLMDVAQGNVIGSYDRCAATVITTVISKPTHERIITDAGAKALTSQVRKHGLVETHGMGYVKGSNGVSIDQMFDEHGIIYNENFSKEINVGDKLEIIPNHICPVCNLYDESILVSKGQIVTTMKISARGKLK